MSIKLIGSEFAEEENNTTCTASISANKGNFVIATFVTRSEFSMPDNWTLLGSGNAITNAGTSQVISMAYYEMPENGTVDFTVSQVDSGRIYIGLVQLYGVSAVEFASEYSNASSNAQTLGIATPKHSEDVLLWSVHSLTWADAYYWKSSTTNMDKFQYAFKQFRMCSFFDATNVSNISFSIVGGTCQIGIIGTRLIENKPKYLIEADGKYYTEVDGNIAEVQINELSAQVFSEYGIDEKDFSANIALGLTNPKFLCWMDSNEEFNQKINVTAVPAPQNIIGTVDLSDSSITGIENVTIQSTGKVLFAIRFGDVWIAYNGNEFVELDDDISGMEAGIFQSISVNQWTALLGTNKRFDIRVTLYEGSVLTNLTVNFTN